MHLSAVSTGKVAVTGVAAAAVIGGALALVNPDKTVTLSVDGTSRVVRTSAATVGGLLDHEGIKISPHDLLSPAPGATLADGQTVVLRYGRPLRVTVDGTERDYWTTERDLGTALRTLGMRAEGVYVSASRSMPLGRQGLAVGMRLPKHVTFLADGTRHEVTTTAPTLGAAMAEADVWLRAEDSVSATLTLAPADGQVVTVTRVTGGTSTAQKPVPFATVRKSSDQLFKGATKVSVTGRPGVLTLVYADTYADGKLTGHRLVRQAVTTPPVTQVVLVGSKPRPAPRPAPVTRSYARVSGSASGLNWAALARCESGGNPRAVNPAGYYGLYQFTLGTWHNLGGSGSPAGASASEQTYRAQLLYQRAGSSPWPSCGRYLYQ